MEVNSNWLDTEMLEDYLDGKLDAKSMHFVERLALEDPFVTEALEGLRQSPRRSSSLSILQKQLRERIELQPAVKSRWRITTHRLSIAATAAILFIAGSVIFWMQEANLRKARSEKQVHVTLTDIRQASASEAVPIQLSVYPMFDKADKGQSAPVGGWNGLREHLIKNNKLLAFPITRLVEVQFRIDANGRPFELKALSSPGEQFTNEAIRLIQSGPDWHPVNAPSKDLKLNSVKVYF